jgi:Flp pilus assembly protein TadB
MYPIPYRDLRFRKRFTGVAALDLRELSIQFAIEARGSEETSLEQEAKAGLLVGSLRYLGLVSHLLHVVVMIMVVMADVVVVMTMVVTMMLGHRGCIRARCADHRHRESQCNCKPEGREEGLLHGSFPFLSRASMKSGR